MSEARSHFSIKNGSIEIDYEGPASEVNKRYDKAFDWVSSQPINAREPETKDQVNESNGKKEKDNRGGSRRAIYGPKIEELIKEKFFTKRKSLDEVANGLVPKNVPTKGYKARNAILINLRRKIASKDSVLKGGKEENTWYFWTD